MAINADDLVIEKRELVHDLLRSPAWEIVQEEIIDNLKQQIHAQIRRLTPATQADGPVLVGQLNTLDKVLDMLHNY